MVDVERLRKGRIRRKLQDVLSKRASLYLERVSAKPDLARLLSCHLSGQIHVTTWRHMTCHTIEMTVITDPYSYAFSTRWQTSQSGCYWCLSKHNSSKPNRSCSGVLILSPSIDVRDYSSADSTRIEIDEEKLLNMEDRLLQEEVAMTRLNPSNDEVLEDFLNSIVDGEVAMEHPTNWCYLYIPLCLKHASINMFKTRFTLT